jgi:hypothetical protein
LISGSFTVPDILRGVLPRLLDVVEGRRLAIDDEPLRYNHGRNGKRSRPVTLANAEGRLLIRLVLSQELKIAPGAVVVSNLRSALKDHGIALAGRGVSLRLEPALAPSAQIVGANNSDST